MLPKKQLLAEVRRLLADPERGISHALFAELAGIDKRLLQRVFITGEMPMTEATQRRVGRAYEHWKEGAVRVMQRIDKTRFVDYRKTPIPPIAPRTSLHVEAGKVRLRVGPANRHDYSEPSLFEALGR